MASDLWKRTALHKRVRGRSQSPARLASFLGRRFSGEESINWQGLVLQASGVDGERRGTCTGLREHRGMLTAVDDIAPPLRFSICLFCFAAVGESEVHALEVFS